MQNRARRSHYSRHFLLVSISVLLIPDFRSTTRVANTTIFELSRSVASHESDASFEFSSLLTRNPSKEGQRIIRRMAMANPWEWLENWVKEHVNATVYDDEAGAKHLGQECLRDAMKAGVNQASLIKAAGGNLTTFMLTELNSAAEREVNRLAEKG
jgi:hypothetical protein